MCLGLEFRVNFYTFSVYPKFPRLHGRFPNFQVVRQISKILGRVLSSGSTFSNRNLTATVLMPSILSLQQLVAITLPLVSIHLPLRGGIPNGYGGKYVATICVIQTASGKYIATVYFFANL